MRHGHVTECHLLRSRAECLPPPGLSHRTFQTGSCMAKKKWQHCIYQNTTVHHKQWDLLYININTNEAFFQTDVVPSQECTFPFSAALYVVRFLFQRDKNDFPETLPIDPFLHKCRNDGTQMSEALNLRQHVTQPSMLVSRVCVHTCTHTLQDYFLLQHMPLILLPELMYFYIHLKMSRNIIQTNMLTGCKK